MNRLVPLVVSFSLLWASLAHAQAGYLGLYTGTYAAIGVQYTAEPIRFSVGLDPFWYGFGLTGAVDVKLGGFSLAPAPEVRLEGYFGAGANAGYYFNSYLFTSGGGLVADAHGLVGLEYRLPGMPYSVYAEIQLGARLLPTVAFYPGGRLGLNFR
ncbi:hypothetical protein DV704_09250 [Meiothermus sp. QL-1]|uniref:hypothetical protein n=1 Tax=Meiothermus sp. QL-1 TaxID=2058095 RepID=UPI000E0B1499|nr:hypothetical protein [Meiothermus sp. QL-1]RDI95037.1 hypothetical protein DV704_09250 [Meiothermus sp. QL-1]